MAGVNPLPIFADAARFLHGESDRTRLAKWAAQAALALVGADLAGVCLLPTDSACEWEIVPRPGSVLRPSAFEALGDPRLHAGLAPVLSGPQGLQALAHPSFTRVGANVVVALPLRGVAEVAYGLLLVAWVEGPSPGSDEMEALATLGLHVGVALDNQGQRVVLEDLRATEQEMVSKLQAAVMPARPDVPFAELGDYYAPAEAGAPTGGDLHDWVLLPDGDLHLAIVDVMGHGLAATKDALVVVHALRLLALDNCPLENLVARADTIARGQNPDLIATAVVGRFNPSTGMLLLAGGGHPPPLLVRDGRATELFLPGCAIGFPGAGSDEVVEVALGRSDSVILYTDGLIEATKDILEGLATLTRSAEETAPYPAEQQARVLVDRTLTGASRRDDSLAVVLRRRVPPEEREVAALGPFEHHLSRTTATISIARGLLREWLTRVPVDDEPAYDLLLVATELCANAVEHASWEGNGVVLRAWAQGRDVVIEVEDDGRSGLAWPVLGAEPPDPEAEQGRGLWLVHTFTDQVEPFTDDARTVIRCLKRAVVAAR